MNDQVAPFEDEPGDSAEGAGGAAGKSSAATPSGSAPPSETTAAGPVPAPPGGGQPSLHQLVTTVCAPSMALSGPDGQIRAAGAQGAYVSDTRVLNELLVTVGEAEPVPLGASPPRGPQVTFWSLCRADRPGPEPKLVLVRQRTSTPDGLLETFTLTSYAPGRLRRRLELKLGCDLAGTGQVNAGGAGRPQPARPVGPGLAWAAPGLGSVLVQADPPPVAVDSERGTLSWELDVTRDAPATVSLALVLDLAPAAAPGPSGNGLPSASTPSVVVSAPRHRTSLGTPHLEADDLRLSRFMAAGLSDLEGLELTLPGVADAVFLAAGAPWYLTLFGRDSIWAARMLLPVGTELALGTLRALAHYQGSGSVPATGEEPGKILHELRRAGPGSAGTATGHSLPPVYYGTVDATALWVCLLHDAWRWGAPEQEVRALLGPMVACLHWLRDFGCNDAGFVTYVDASGRGLANQGWKDSADGVQSRAGQLAEPPVALCEVQGYTYEAAMAGAVLLEAFPDVAAAAGQDPGEWRQFAARLADHFRDRFWVEDEAGPYPAIALDGQGRPVDSLTSNIGHLLSTGILSLEESGLVSGHLGRSALDCGFGLRTMASSSAGYNPLSYHCGSVWGHDTAIAITGLARVGTPVAHATAASLAEGLLSAAEAFGYRLPELFGGHRHAEVGRPLPYPAACRPQAWTAASAVAVVAALAGIAPDLPHHRMSLNPVPSPIGLRSVRGFKLGGHPLAVELNRDGTGVVTSGPPGLEVEGHTAIAAPGP